MHPCLGASLACRQRDRPTVARCQILCGFLEGEGLKPKRLYTLLSENFVDANRHSLEDFGGTDVELFEAVELQQSSFNRRHVGFFRVWRAITLLNILVVLLIAL